MQTIFGKNNQFISLWGRMLQFSIVSHPAAGLFSKPGGAKKHKSRRAALPVQSPDSVHLRAAGSKELRKNPAP